jgi:four helix bundle protein
MIAKRFQELICWQKAKELSIVVYEVTTDIKDFELRNQLRRAALSAMNNIAEGFRKYHSKEFRRYLEYTTASCLEIESMTILMEHLKFIKPKAIISIRNKSIETYNITAAFAKSLNKSDT